MRIFVFTIAVLLCNNLFSQKGADLRQQQKMKELETLIWSDKDPEFKSTEVPETYKNESAVILCQKLSLIYQRKKETIIATTINRRRIKLMDKNAVKEFSEIYYYSNKETLAGVIICKKDGHTEKVDMSTAIEVKVETEKKVPGFFKINTIKGSYQYKKIAIPNLEEGDIIDYFVKNEFSFPDYECYDLPSFAMDLCVEYPIVKQYVDFHFDNDFYYNIRSINGAPELKFKGNSIFTDSNEKPIKWYRIEDSNRAKESDERWLRRFRVLPIVKFQVLYMNKVTAKISKEFILPDSFQRNTIPTEEIIKRFYYKFQYLFLYSNHLKVNDAIEKIKEPAKFAQEAYYFLRYEAIDYYLLKHMNPENPIYEEFENGKDTDLDFITKYLSLLKMKNIKCDMLLTIPSTRGDLKDVIYRDEITCGVRVYLNGQEIYVFNDNNYRVFGEIPFNLEGAEAIAIPMPGLEEKKKNQMPAKYEIIRLPVSSSDKNIYKSEFNLAVNENEENLKINVKGTLKGLFKEDYLNILAYDYYFLKDDSTYFKFKKSPILRDNFDVVLRMKTRAKNVKRFEKEQKEKVSEWLKDDYADAVLSDFAVSNYGRYSDKPDLTYTLNFSIKNIVSKAGNNLIIEIGKLLGSQVKLTDKELVRTNDIYLTNSKCIVNVFHINIPQGYRIENIESLNTSLENECCSFKTTATLEGNTLQLSTEKVYKHNFDTKDKWPMYVEMLEAAYTFSQKKVIIKKTI